MERLSAVSAPGRRPPVSGEGIARPGGKGPTHVGQSRKSDEKIWFYWLYISFGGVARGWCGTLGLNQPPQLPFPIAEVQEKDICMSLRLVLVASYVCRGLKGPLAFGGNPSLECSNESSCEAVTSEIKSSGSTTCGAPLKLLMVSNFLIRSCDLVPSFRRHLVRREEFAKTLRLS